MRAGLLSDREVIKELNQRFVCTTVIIDDVTARAKNGDELAQKLVLHWEYPLELVFLTPAGELVSKLNSFQDFPGVHADVSAPKADVPIVDEHSHVNIFLKHVAAHFGKK